MSYRRNLHDEDLRLRCPGCRKRFDTREGVAGHMRSTLHAMPDDCAECGGEAILAGGRWLLAHNHYCAAYASAIEAATAGETTKIGSTEGESAVGAAETPNPSPESQA